MAAQPKLAAIPVELFEHIASYLPGRGLLSLRLASRETAVKSYTVFLKAYAKSFEHVGFMGSSRKSLEAALIFATIFSPVIRTMTLFADEALTFEATASGKALYRRDWQQRHEVNQVLWEGQEVFRSNVGTVTTLKSLFDKLEKVSQIIIANHKQLDSISRVKPWLGDMDMGTYEIEDFFQPNDTSTVCMWRNIVQALAESENTSIDTITMHSAWMFGNQIPQFDPASVARAFKNITHLSLMVSFNNPDTTRDNIETNSNGAQNLVQLLTSIPNLETLTLILHRDDSEIITKDCIDSRRAIMQHLLSATFASLQILDIARGKDINFDSLVSFVNRHPKLRKLDLHGCRVFKDGSTCPSAAGEGVKDGLLRLTGLEEVKTGWQTEGQWERRNSEKSDPKWVARRAFGWEE